jgi:hypothetical protein
MQLGKTLTAAIGLALASVGMADAEKILKSEPEGHLCPGQRVLVARPGAIFDAASNLLGPSVLPYANRIAAQSSLLALA